MDYFFDLYSFNFLFLERKVVANQKRGKVHNMSVETVTRIQFDLPDTKIADLDRIMEEGGIKTRKELFNNALSLLEWAIKQRKTGRVIAAVDETSDSYRELSMPI